MCLFLKGRLELDDEVAGRWGALRAIDGQGAFEELSELRGQRRSIVLERRETILTQQASPARQCAERMNSVSGYGKVLLRRRRVALRVKVQRCTRRHRLLLHGHLHLQLNQSRCFGDNPVYAPPMRLP